MESRDALTLQVNGIQVFAIMSLALDTATSTAIATKFKKNDPLLHLMYSQFFAEHHP
jgi:hypothetical protein